MRPIKFRAWDLVNKVMVNNPMINFVDKDGFFWRTFGNQTTRSDMECELMQFTGLTDCKGKEIWEGDIIRGYFDYSDDDGQACGEKNEGVREVKWGNQMQNWPGFGADEINFGEFEIEVIGNIYEHPDLLK